MGVWGSMQESEKFTCEKGRHLMIAESLFKSVVKHLSEREALCPRSKPDKTFQTVPI